jgi:hypothetical protein
VQQDDRGAVAQLLAAQGDPVAGCLEWGGNRLVRGFGGCNL